MVYEDLTDDEWHEFVSDWGDSGVSDTFPGMIAFASDHERWSNYPSEVIRRAAVRAAGGRNFDVLPLDQDQH